MSSDAPLALGELRLAFDFYREADGEGKTLYRPIPMYEGSMRTCLGQFAHSQPDSTDSPVDMSNLDGLVVRHSFTAQDCPIKPWIEGSKPVIRSYYQSLEASVAKLFQASQDFVDAKDACLAAEGRGQQPSWAQLADLDDAERSLIAVATDTQAFGFQLQRLWDSIDDVVGTYLQISGTTASKPTSDLPADFATYGKKWARDYVEVVEMQSQRALTRLSMLITLLHRQNDASLPYLTDPSVRNMPRVADTVSSRARHMAALLYADESLGTTAEAEPRTKQWYEGVISKHCEFDKQASESIKSTTAALREELGESLPESWEEFRKGQEKESVWRKTAMPRHADVQRARPSPNVPPPSADSVIPMTITSGGNRQARRLWSDVVRR